MKSILFVDDEPHVLRGLQLHARRDEWTMRFAGSGDEALPLLSQSPALEEWSQLCMTVDSNQD